MPLPPATQKWEDYCVVAVRDADEGSPGGAGLPH